MRTLTKRIRISTLKLTRDLNSIIAEKSRILNLKGKSKSLKPDIKRKSTYIKSGKYTQQIHFIFRRKIP